MLKNLLADVFDLLAVETKGSDDTERHPDKAPAAKSAFKKVCAILD